MSGDRQKVNVGYDDQATMDREDTRVRAIFKKDTGQDEHMANLALPPVFAYSVNLTPGAIDELKAIPGVWVKT